jgi:hypothetical protein
MNSIQITSGFQLTELINKVIGQIEKNFDERKEKWLPLFEIIDRVLIEYNYGSPGIEYLQEQMVPFMFKGNLGIQFKDASLRFTIFWHRELIIKELNKFPKIKIKITNIIFC